MHDSKEYHVHGWRTGSFNTERNKPQIYTVLYIKKKKISDARDPSSISGHAPDENSFSAISFLVFCFSILVNCIQYSLCMYEDYRFVISVIIQPDK